MLTFYTTSFGKEENGDTTDYKLSSHYFTNSPYNQIFFFVSLSLSFVSRQKKESFCKFATKSDAIDITNLLILHNL